MRTTMPIMMATRNTEPGSLVLRDLLLFMEKVALI